MCCVYRLLEDVGVEESIVFKQGRIELKYKERMVESANMPTWQGTRVVVYWPRLNACSTNLEVANQPTVTKAIEAHGLALA